MKKEHFVVYGNWAKLISNLPDETAGKVIKAMCIFQLTGEMVESEQTVGAILSMIYPEMQENNEKYATKCERLRKNASSSVSKCKQIESEMLTNQEREESISGSDTDTDTDTDTVSSTKIVYVSNTDVLDCRAEALQVVEMWNSLPASVTKIKKLIPNKARDKLLRARIKEYSMADISAAIENIRQSDFLQGKNKNGWTITFDWFIRPNNFPKVLDGQYNGHPKEATTLDDYMMSVINGG